MAENVTLGSFSTLQNSSIVSTLNANNSLIETAFADCVSLAGTSPNSMLSNLDMNNYQIINLPAASTINSPLRVVDFTTTAGVSGSAFGLLAGNQTWTGTNMFSNISSINMPPTTSSTVGVITVSNVPYFHAFGTNNLFIGPNAGNFTTTSQNNISIGSQTLQGLTTGNGGDGSNTAVGFNSLQFVSSGFYNTAVGGLALQHVTSGRHNTAVGLNALGGVTTGIFNVGIGSDIGVNVTSGSANTMLGFAAGQGIVTGSFNTIIGSGFPSFSDVSNIVVLADGNNGVRFDYGYTTASTITLTGPTAVTSTLKATGLIATGDPGGTASTTTISNTNSTTISTGVGSVKMSSANPGTNAVWLKFYSGTTAYWVPGWTTNSP